LNSHVQDFHWPDGYRAAAIVSVDMDGESGVLYDHPHTETHLNVVAHQGYDALSGVPRLLRLFDRLAIKTSFYIPGFTAERWPDVVQEVRDAGHEIGHHGYLHEPVHGVDEATEEGYLLRGLEALDKVAGVRPVGYRAPKGRLNFRTPRLLAKHGFLYDTSLMDTEYPYRLASGPEPDAPSVIELPIQWSTDDWSQFAFMPGLMPGTTVESPTKALEVWALDLEGIAAEGGIFIITLHPYLIGRPSRARILEELVERMKAIDGLWITTGQAAAEHAATQDLTPRFHRPVKRPEGLPIP
jgi:peptidoglycan/xylan/chitin deacetylase (PgdA/CDA1 family)